MVAHALEAVGMAPRTAAELTKTAGLSMEETQTAVSKLVAAGKATSFTVEGNVYYLDVLTFKQTLDRVNTALTDYHQSIRCARERRWRKSEPAFSQKSRPDLYYRCLVFRWLTRLCAKEIVSA